MIAPIHRLRRHHWPRIGPYYHWSADGRSFLRDVLCYRCLWGHS